MLPHRLISKHNVHDLNVNHLTPHWGSYNCVREDSSATRCPMTIG